MRQHNLLAQYSTPWYTTHAHYPLCCQSTATLAARHDKLHTQVLPSRSSRSSVRILNGCTYDLVRSCRHLLRTKIRLHIYSGFKLYFNLVDFDRFLNTSQFCHPIPSFPPSISISYPMMKDGPTAAQQRNPWGDPVLPRITLPENVGGMMRKVRIWIFK